MGLPELRLTYERKATDFLSKGETEGRQPHSTKSEVRSFFTIFESTILCENLRTFLRTDFVKALLHNSTKKVTKFHVII